jgi:hypothetical protein
MEKISKTELYQRGIPLLAFLPIIALLSERTAGGALGAGKPQEGSAQGFNPGCRPLEPKA